VGIRPVSSPPRPGRPAPRAIPPSLRSSSPPARWAPGASGSGHAEPRLPGSSAFGPFHIR